MLLALLVFLVPGYAWILVSGLYSRLGLLERLALAFLLSVGFSSLLTAAFSFVTSNYVFYSSVVSLVASFIAIAVSLGKRRRSIHLDLRFRISRRSLPLGVAVAVLGLALLLLFWSAPFYPAADSDDPIFHAQVVSAIQNGDARSVLLHANFAPGLHFASAVMANLVSVSPVDSLRILLSLVLLDALVLTYFAARAVLGSQELAGITVLVAALAMPVDAIHFIRVGTYPNVLADAITLAMLWLVFSYMDRPGISLGLTLVVLGLTGVFVHSSFLLFLAAMWAAIPVLLLVVRTQVRNYFKAVAFSTSGPILFAIVLSGFFARSLERITGYVTTTPVILMLQQLVWNFVAFIGPINTLAIALATLYVIRKRRSSIGRSFVVCWLLFLIAASFFSSSDWRFILFSLLPGTFLVGDGIGSAFGVNTTTVNEKTRSAKTNRKQLLLALGLLVLIGSGGFLGILERAYSPSTRNRQEAVFDSMQWLKQNDAVSGVASVELRADYRYLQVLTGIPYIGDFAHSAGEVFALSKDEKFAYVAVAVQSSYLQSFQLDGNFKEEYRNSIVVIFFIVH